MTDSPTLFTLFESATGYAIFEVVAFEEIGALLEGAMETVTDLARFGRAVKLKAFQPFESAEDALANANAISEHAVSDSLSSFLEMNLPKVRSKKGDGRFVLGVLDPALATAICEAIPGMACRSDDTIREIVRGCRLHLDRFVKGLASATRQAQLGLSHSYSRAKVKFNPARSDNMIIQSIALLDQLDKDLNTFAMRLKECYSWHFPELRLIVKDSYMFARCVALIQDKRSLLPTPPPHDEHQTDHTNSEIDGAAGDQHDKLPGLNQIVGTSDMAQSIVAAARTSMGMDCSAVDMINIVNFTQRMVKLAEFRKQLAFYLSEKMTLVAPNLKALIGDTVAARLISKAGSLTNLAKAPASTVQILGAEKALFRALKTKGNTPKYGLIYHSTFIGRADSKNKGRISRYLANKCSIATRIDSFSDDHGAIGGGLYGEMLREQVEERLKFYETGASPRKNLDVMQDVLKRLASSSSSDNKKPNHEDATTEEEEKERNDAMIKTPKKHKKEKKDKKLSSKKRKNKEEVEADDTLAVDKEKVEEQVLVDEDQVEEEETIQKSAKKAKRDDAMLLETNNEEELNTREMKRSAKKDRKKKKDTQLMD